MKTTLSEREGNAVKLAVEVSGEELQEAFDTQLARVAREVRIPGFRQGKVPKVMVRQRLGDEAILAGAIEEAMSGWFSLAVKELNLDPVDRPQIELGDETPELGKPLGFTASVTVMPEVVLGQYRGVEVPKDPAEVEDQEVDAQVERLRNEFAELRPVSGRAAKKDDFVTADFRVVLDGKPVERLEASDFAFEVGGNRLFPEIEEQALGMNAGQERTFSLTLPEDFADDDLKGKTVDFTIALKEIKEKVLPRLTDKWASEVSEFGTLLELRLEIRKKLQGAKTYASDQRFRSLAVKAVTDNAALDLPDVVVREQAEEMVSDFKRSLESQGGSFDAYLEAGGVTAEQLIENMKPEAANNVKTGLVLDAVARAEGIEASDEEIGAAVAKLAAAARVDPKVFEARLRKTGRIDAIRWQIIRDKAADFIAANAVAVAPEAAAATLATTSGATKVEPAAEAESEPSSAAETDAAAGTTPKAAKPPAGRRAATGARPQATVAVADAAAQSDESTTEIAPAEA